MTVTTVTTATTVTATRQADGDDNRNENHGDHDGNGDHDAQTTTTTTAHDGPRRPTTAHNDDRLLDLLFVARDRLILPLRQPISDIFLRLRRHVCRAVPCACVLVRAPVRAITNMP